MFVARLVRSVVLLAGACVPAALVGCGGPASAEVSGALTLNGQPPKLQGLQITFIAADGRMTSAAVGLDGSYKANGVPVGPNGIGFVYIPISEVPQHTPSGPKVLPTSKPGPNAPPATESPTPNPIPVQLRDASTSHLTLKVEGGKNNVFNYDIRP